MHIFNRLKDEEARYDHDSLVTPIATLTLIYTKHLLLPFSVKVNYTQQTEMCTYALPS